MFGNVSKAIEELEACNADVQKQFTAWSKAPPLAGNRQTRFANRLDEWAIRLKGVLASFHAGMTAAAALPAFSRCSTLEKEAKRIAAGLKALHTEDVLRDLCEQIQSLANQARQPLTREESQHLWNEFEGFVKHLGLVLDEMRAVQQLMKDTLRRISLATARAHEQKLIASRRARITSTSRAPLADAVRNGEAAEKALARLDGKVDKLRDGIGQILHDLQTFASDKSSRKRLVSHHDEVLQMLTQYQLRAEVFLASLEEDEECCEIMRASETSPVFDIATAIRGLMDCMKEKSAWCVGWMEIIRRREAAVFVLPREIPEQLARFIRQLQAISKKLDQRRGGRGRSLAPNEARLPEREATKLTDHDIRVLQLMVSEPTEGGGLHTVKSLAAATGLNEQKVRRILVDRLGKKGLGVVSRKKPLRGKGNTSPLDLFYVEPALVAHVRQIVQSR